jgi:FixJ family two-component response regulator
MPRMFGLELQAKRKEEQRNVRIIFITAHGTRMRIQSMRRGAVEFPAKLFDPQLLFRRVRSALNM